MDKTIPITKQDDVTKERQRKYLIHRFHVVKKDEALPIIGLI
jgi:hypothetical protein